MGDNSSTMKLLNLSKIFDKKIFRIPDYQRGYAWETQQLEDFYSDLERLQKINSENEKMHYCGLLTVDKVDEFEGDDNSDLKYFKENQGAEFKYFHIIDGQQRLTTSIILIQVLVEKLKENNLNTDDIRKKYLWINGDNGGTYFIFGYVKDNPSFEFFKTDILKGISTANNNEQSLYTKRLSDAKIYFKKKLEKENKADKELKKLLETLTENFQFNFYQIDKNLDIHVTFETMNNRGKKLSTLELLKNRLFYLVSLLNLSTKFNLLSENKKINDVWKEIYKYLGKNQDAPLDDDDFLNDHWIMYYRYQKKKGRIFSTSLLNEEFTPNRVKNKKENEECKKTELEIKEIQEYINSLKESVIIWFYIHSPEDINIKNFNSKDLSNIKKWLNRLNRLGLRYFCPLIMSLLLCLQKEKINAQQVIGILEKIEKFIFLVFSISRNRSRVFDTQFYGFAKDLNESIDKEKLISIIEEINNLLDFKDKEKDKEKARYINVGNFEIYMKNKKYNFYIWDGIRYFLYEYEVDLRDADKTKSYGEDLNWNKFIKHSKKDHKTIEHIYPQSDNPSEYWKKMFKNFIDDKEKNYKLQHSLGNLLPLSTEKNSALQDYDFEKKKNNPDKERCGYYWGCFSERDVVDKYSEWTPQTILDRGRELLKFLEKRWGIEITDKEKLLGLEFLNDISD